MGDFDFSSRLALVTGAGKGLGREIAAAFAAHGAMVAAQDFSPVNLDETLARISRDGGRVRDYVFDLAKKMPVQALVEQVLSDWGQIDILVNSASVRPPHSILKMDEWDWHRTIDTNLGGPFLTMQSVGRVMQDLGGGAIVNIATAVEPAAAWRREPAYYASMMGLVGLTRQAALEFAAHGVRVNAVCPRRIAAGLTRESGEPSAALGDQLTPQENYEVVVERVLYLCSPQASDLTGQVIELDI